MSNLSVWLTPIWLLAVGVSVGAVVLGLLWLGCFVLNRRTAKSLLAIVKESILLPISYVVIASILLALIASPIMPLERMVNSLKRLSQVGTIPIEMTIDANTTDQPLNVSFRSDELTSYSLSSEQDLAINLEPGRGFVDPLLFIEDSYKWVPNSVSPRFFDEDVTTLYVTNESNQATVLSGAIETDVVMPEVHQMALVAISVVGLYLAYFLISWLAPRVSVIATATAKEAVSQPMFLLLTILGAVALITYIVIPYNTFGEDVKMLIVSGTTTIKILAILVALWTASVSVADEIEGRTALTVLSKPVGRGQFILGKFLGIVWPLLLMFILLGIVFLVATSYKVVYDARESSKSVPEWQLCYAEIVRVVPALVLAFFEAVVLAAISVAISTRLAMLPNLIICGTVYVLGHLGSLIVKSAAGDIVFVKFIGRLISVVFPVLDHYEVEGAIAGAATVPTSYLMTAMLYSLLYCAAAMLLALIFFEDRDLA